LKTKQTKNKRKQNETNTKKLGSPTPSLPPTPSGQPTPQVAPSSAATTTASVGNNAQNSQVFFGLILFALLFISFFY
jgi:hypothetical protein